MSEAPKLQIDPQPVATQQHRCPNCGKENAIEGRFCLHCGHEMPSVSASQITREAAPATPRAILPQAQPVTVVDINMNFVSMVVFMVKWTLASIPALIILLLMLVFISAVLGGVLGSILYSLGF